MLLLLRLAAIMSRRSTRNQMHCRAWTNASTVLAVRFTKVRLCTSSRQAYLSLALTGLARTQRLNVDALEYRELLSQYVENC